MATRIRKTHFLIALLSAWMGSFKRALAEGGTGSIGGATAPGSAHTHAFTGTAPAGAEVEAATGTGYATAAQVVTTTENFTLGLNQYAGHWLLVQGEAPCLIVSHPAVTGAPVALTVFGLAPPTSGSAFKILRAPTPAGANAAESAHTHTAGSLSAGAASDVHLDAGEFTVTAPVASDLATSITLAKALVVSYAEHIADDLAHLLPDTTNDLPDPVEDILASIVSLTEVMDVANGIKDSLNLHFTQAGVHPNDDVARTITSPDATDQGSANTLLNEIRTDLNAHMGDALALPGWRAVEG